MGANNEILDAIEIIVDKKLKNVAQIYLGLVKAVSTSTKQVVAVVNSKEYHLRYYGDAPTVNLSYPVFVPNGNMSLAFMISG